MCAVRGRDIGMIFQEPMTALNPLQTIGEQVAETVRVHGRAAAREIAAQTLERVGLPQSRFPLDALSARALGRPAPARRDRDGDRASAEAADRRRADDGARRHHPGPDPRAAAPARRRGRDGADADHPRPRRRRGDGRPRRDHDRGAGGRERADADGDARDAASLHPGAVRGLGSRARARAPAAGRGPAPRCRGRGPRLSRRWHAALRPARDLPRRPRRQLQHRRGRVRRAGRGERIGQVDAGPRHPRARAPAGRQRARRRRGGGGRRAHAGRAPRQDAGGVPGPLRQLQSAAQGGAAGLRALPPAARCRRPATPGAPPSTRR